MNEQYNVFGIRRSGNHTIIEYIASHFDRTVHHNDCEGWKVDRNRQFTYGDPNLPIGCVIHSYEDFEPSTSEILGETTVVILRDFYNICASRIKSGRGLDTCRRRYEMQYGGASIEGVWMKYANLYLEYPDKFILFNKWNSSEEYRGNVKTRFGLNRDVEYVKELPKSGIGYGSSFGQLGGVNERYLEVMNNLDIKLYNRVFCNKEINDLNERIFGVGHEFNK